MTNDHPSEHRYTATFFRSDRILGTRPCDRFQDAPAMARADLKRADRIQITRTLPVLDGDGAIFVRVAQFQMGLRWPFFSRRREWVRKG